MLYLGFVRNIWRFGEITALRPAPVMLVCGDGDRGLVFSGKRYAQLLDSINDRLTEAGIETLTVSLPFSKLSTDSAYGNVFSVNGMLGRASVRDKFTRLIARIFSCRSVARIEAWSKILDRVQPKVIIGIQPPSEFCIAAKNKGIWVADLQHGIVSDEGYYGPAYREKYDQSGWPSCILCWDAATENWIRNQIGALTSTKVIGHPWVIRFIYPHNSDKLVNEYIHNVVAEKPARLTILVSLQWGLCDCHETGLPEELLKFIKGDGQAFDWWLRVHPVMLQGMRRAETFASLASLFSSYPNVFWEHCTDLPLPLVLKQVTLHMTVSSAVTIEAGWFGVKTALLGQNTTQLHQWLGEEIRTGSAEIVAMERDNIKQWIERNAQGARSPSALDCGNGELLDGFISEIEDCLAEFPTDRRALTPGQFNSDSRA